jgi:cellulose synthase/poly-beta-1,6-N-acetylglucosamine synthase-like glycosyltransferase
MKHTPLISVVVIGHNEGERLSRCLKSVRQNHYQTIELIYIDSNSDDNSLINAMNYADRVYPAEQVGAAAARNLGIAKAQGEWVMFLDGDTTLAPYFLSQALRALQAQAQMACVWGHRVEQRPDQSIYVQVLDLDWRYKPGETEFCGGDALFRRTALLQVNGFNPDLMAGEEPEMCFRLRKLGWHILHIDEAMTSHDLAINSFKQYWQRSTRAGYAYAAVSAQGHQFWRYEVRHNLRQSLILLTLLVLILLAHFQLPLLSISALILLASLMLRSSWRSRWRSSDWPTLLMYGAHSWLAQIPISWGIWRFRRALAHQQTASFANYKQG